MLLPWAEFAPEPGSVRSPLMAITRLVGENVLQDFQKRIEDKSAHAGGRSHWCCCWNKLPVGTWHEILIHDGFCNNVCLLGSSEAYELSDMPNKYSFDGEVAVDIHLLTSLVWGMGMIHSVISTIVDLPKTFFYSTASIMSASLLNVTVCPTSSPSSVWLDLLMMN